MGAGAVELLARGFRFAVEVSLWSVAPILIVLVLAGLGAWAVRGASADLALASAATAGALVVITGVSVANLFVPVPRATVLVIVPAGLVLFAAAWKRLELSVGSFVGLLPWFVIPTAIYRLGRRSLAYDVFLYHGGIVEWLSREPTPQGLGLLHSRFAFNPALPLLMASFRSTGDDWSHHVLLEITVVVLAAVVLGGMVIRARRRQDPQLLGFLVTLTTLSATFLLVRDVRVGNDLAAGMTVIAAVAVAATILRPGVWSEGRELTAAYGLLGLFVVFAVLQKTSSAPALLLLLAPWVARDEPGRRGAGVSLRPLIPTLAVSSIAGVAMMVRTWVMAGCLAYPVAITCVDGPSALGPDRAAAESAGILSWARSGPADHRALLDLSWVPSWFGDLPVSAGVRVATFAVIVGLAVRLLRVGVAGQRTVPAPRLLWITATLAVAFWFVAAPDPRFGFPGMLVLGALVLAPAFTVDAVRPPVERRSVPLLSAAVAVAVVAGAVLLGGGRYFPFSGAVGHPFEEAVLLAPDGDPSTGWRYVVPFGSDQCGDAFPCAPGPVDLTVEREGTRLVFRQRAG